MYYSGALACTSQYSIWSFRVDAGNITGDQNWTPPLPNLPLPFEDQKVLLDVGAKGATEAENRHGIERKGENGGSKQSQSSEKMVTLSEQKQQQQGGPRTGVFEGSTRFQLQQQGGSSTGFQLTRNPGKHFQFLPRAEALPPKETLGGYIFMCNNDTMQENLKRQLFGLPARYRDSVRAIQPGLPLFLYNYTTHQLHGIFEAASFGGSNIDPTAWEDKKCRGESRYPAQVLAPACYDRANTQFISEYVFECSSFQWVSWNQANNELRVQVRVRVRRLCKPLQEEDFRPLLHHYDGPKFRLQLSVEETLQLLDKFNGQPENTEP